MICKIWSLWTTDQYSNGTPIALTNILTNCNQFQQVILILAVNSCIGKIIRCRSELHYTYVWWTKRSEEMEGKTAVLLNSFSLPRGTQRQFSGKYLFGRRFQNQNFRNICCKISCLPASPRIFEHLQFGIITHFKRIFTLKKATQNFREPFPG